VFSYKILFCGSRALEGEGVEIMIVTVAGWLRDISTSLLAHKHCMHWWLGKRLNVSWT